MDHDRHDHRDDDHEPPNCAEHVGTWSRERFKCAQGSNRCELPEATSLAAGGDSYSSKIVERTTANWYASDDTWWVKERDSGRGDGRRSAPVVKSATLKSTWNRGTTTSTDSHPGSQSRLFLLGKGR